MTELGPAARIGRYQLVAPIGAGGMGRVWVALDTAAPALRLVALKTALAGTDPGADEQFWALLSDEAALASRVDHPNVCATFELGQEGSTHFLVMDWSDGASLREVLDASPGKRLSPELAAFITASVAAGLHAVHELCDEDGHSLGVVHRDVSPQNVLVSLRGHVRLADFGVAKARGQQHRPTQTGEVKGKLSYMAPEQVTSKNIDRRSDVFALGCVLYEAALGVRPFHGGDALATMYKILEEPLTLPRALEPGFPEPLQQILIKALAKSPDARYQSAEELRLALVEYLSSTRRFFADKHVAELVSGLLGDGLRARNRDILTAAEQLRRGETDPARLRSPPPPAPTRTLTPEGGVERSVSAARLTARSSFRSSTLAALGATALVVASLSLWELRTRAQGPRSASPVPATASAATFSARPPTPPGAEERTPPAPSTAPVVPAPAAPSTTGAFARTRPRPLGPTAISTPSKPAAKKPRPIDRDNPFANP